MNDRLSEQALLRLLSELPREVPPGNDPWPGIAARISGVNVAPVASAPRRAWIWRAAAASVAIAIIAGIWVTSGRNVARPPSEPSVAVASPDRGQAPSVSTLAGLVAASEAEYQAAFREFIPVGDYSRQNLPPQTLEKIEMGWAEMRTAEAALSAALEQNPNDRFLNNRMLELRARQLGFLQQLASLDLANRRMNT